MTFYIQPDEDRRVRQACLELALKAAGDPLVNARRFYAFVTDAESKSPRERILQALEDARVT